MAERLHSPSPASPGARTVHKVLLDIEKTALNVRRLAIAVNLIASYALTEKAPRNQCCDAFEMLAEALEEHGSQLSTLCDEGTTLNGEVSHGR